MGVKKKTSGQAYIDYWKDRALQREALYQSGSQKTITAMNRAYSRAFDNIQKQVESVVQNLDKKGGVSAPDADAYYYRLDTLKALQGNVYDELKKLEDIERKATTTRYADVMREGYYRTMFDIQKGTKLAFSFSKLPQKAIEETMLAGWKGRNYSKSIWQNTEKLAGLAEEIIKGGLLSGAPIQTMVSQLDEVMHTGQFICERLIRSETNYFANQGELRSYEQAGIEKYEFLATLDNKTSEVCAGLDGEVKAVEAAVVGVNYPPMHAFCRSTTVAHIDDHVIDGLKRRARGKNGELILVPADMKYEEWKEKYTYYIPTENEKEKDRTKILKNSSEIGILNIGGGNMVNTGASGAIPRNDRNRMDKHAELYYAEIRKRIGDIETISENTGFSAEDIRKVKEHIFENFYNLGGLELERFEADYDIAVSWQRLLEGKNIQEMDLVLLNHELVEYALMNEKGLSYSEAHVEAAKLYNYSKYTKSLDLKEGIK